jgi:hypothetical protein
MPGVPLLRVPTPRVVALKVVTLKVLTLKALTLKALTLKVVTLRVVTQKVLGIATAMVVCCGSAFAQMGGGGQLTNPGAGPGGSNNNPNAAVNPGISDGSRDNFPTTVTRSDPPAGGNQVPLRRTPSANDPDDEQR